MYNCFLSNKKDKLIVFFWVMLSSLAPCTSVAAESVLRFNPIGECVWSSQSCWSDLSGRRVERLPGLDDYVVIDSDSASTDAQIMVPPDFEAVCQGVAIGGSYPDKQVDICIGERARLICGGTNVVGDLLVGYGGNGTLWLRGGRIEFNNKSATHRNLRVLRSSVGMGIVRGWGVVNSAPEITNVRMENSGKVVADGKGEPRVLDLHGIVSTTNLWRESAADPGGWYAVNKGCLQFPRSWVNGVASSVMTRCLGDVYSSSEPEMVNSASITFKGLERRACFLRGGLFAVDHPELPALPKGRCVGVWGLGLCLNNREWSDSSLGGFATAAITARYDNTNLKDGTALILYRYEEEKWRVVGEGLVKKPYRISTLGELSKIETGLYNIGLFALVAAESAVGELEYSSALSQSEEEGRGVVIDKMLPAGNIKFGNIRGNTVYLENEVRDTSGWWFYWAFKAMGAAGRSLRFEFTNGSPVCTRGPCVSLDKGATWWYAANSFDARSFTYTFPANADEVWFAMGMVYTQRDWDTFLSEHKERNRFFKSGVLCKSRKSRDVEKLRLGCIDKAPKYRVFISARHHSAEMMASYVVEGIVNAVLSDSDLGGWLRENVEFMIVPFVDKDGVEDGDQGKNRKPHDHNRDYDQFIYPETKALTEWIESHAQNRVEIAVDIHCPWIRGKHNEWVYQVYSEDDRNTASQRRLGELLYECQRGAMDYRVSDDLPFGEAWNTGNNYSAGRSFRKWATESLEGNKVSTTFEIPFATANSAVVTPESCRQFGEDLALSFKLLLLDF